MFLPAAKDSAQVADRFLHPRWCRCSVDDTVRITAEDLRRVPGGANADWVHAGELAGVLAVLVVRMDPHADEVEIRPVGDGADRVLPDSAGGPDCDFVLSFTTSTPFSNTGP